MDNININNLFPEAKSINKPLSVHTLYNPKETKIRDEDEFNIDKLKLVRKEFKDKIRDIYKKIYNKCLKKITSINRKNITETIFDIPMYMFGEDHYNPNECIKFIERRLGRLGMETVILTGLRIYISWNGL